MKSFIIGLGMFVLSMTFTVYQYDYNFHQEQVTHLKFAAEEAAAGAAQYVIALRYSEGKIAFNQKEGEVAAKYILQQQLKLDDNMVPFVYSYWQDQVQASIEFFDDGNTNFPYVYHHETDPFVYVISQPSVVITVNAGKPRYRLLKNPPEIIRVAVYELKER